MLKSKRFLCSRLIPSGLIISVLIASLFLLTACSAGEAASAKSTASSKTGHTKSNFISSSITKDYVDVVNLAQQYGVSDGKMALALIICKLDDTTSIDDLKKKESSELFEILTETATQKSVTLETIDQQYKLTDILQTEGIDVTIQANNVTSAASSNGAESDTKSSASKTPVQPGSESWIDQFETAINAN